MTRMYTANSTKHYVLAKIQTRNYIDRFLPILAYVLFSPVLMHCEIVGTMDLYLAVTEYIVISLLTHIAILLAIYHSKAFVHSN